MLSSRSTIPLPLNGREFIIRPITTSFLLSKWTRNFFTITKSNIVHPLSLWAGKPILVIGSALFKYLVQFAYFDI